MAEAHTKHHDYHLVNPSPWPIVGSLAALVLAIGAIAWMRTGNGGLFGVEGPWLFAIGALGVAATMIVWWRDVIHESVVERQHTPVVQLHLRYGMILFIASEVMFFVAWFWAYFDAALFPGATTLPDGETVGLVARQEATGGHWPPEATGDGRFVSTFNPWGLPLVNTLVLLLSGTTVTWAHHALLQNDRRGLVWGLLLTVLLGILFTSLQAYEYMHAGFEFSGFIYGSVFFMATGFHGAHVIIGTIFLIVCLGRALAGQFTPEKHFGFEAAAWYWHFVDVVWLFLFASIYVWGAGTPAAGH
ncbi:MAG: cytochrome c oxidase subunit 3 [Dichotomicrobium sp.]